MLGRGTLLDGGEAESRPPSDEPLSSSCEEAMDGPSSWGILFRAVWCGESDLMGGSSFPE